MNIANPEVLELVLCPECGASCQAGTSRCWLCGATLVAAQNAEQFVTAEIVEPHREAATFSLATLLIMVTVAAVLFGVWAEDPEVGLGLTVIVAPALLATAFTAWRRRRRGKPLTIGGKILTFLISAAAVLGVLALLAVAAFIALLIFCFVAMSGGGFGM